MESHVYLVFNSMGELIRTRLITPYDCFYRSVDKAEKWADASKTYVDLGSQCCFFDKENKNLSPLDAMKLFDHRFDLIAEHVFTIYL